MAETTYTYSVQDDFPNQQVEISALEAEILGSSITTALVGINLDGDNCDITFEDALSAPDKTTLDGIVANHQGVPLFGGVQRVNSEGEDTNATTTYQDKLTLNSQPLQGGDYLIIWYAEISLSSLIVGSGVFAQVRYNGVERGFSSSSSDQYMSFSGSATVTVEAGEAPSIVVAFRRVGVAATAQMRRVRVSIAPIMTDAGGGS